MARGRNRKSNEYGEFWPGYVDVLSTLLHQTVVPTDRRIARQVLAAVAATASRLKGIKLDLGDDVYSDAGQLASLENALS